VVPQIDNFKKNDITQKKPQHTTQQQTDGVECHRILFGGEQYQSPLESTNYPALNAAA
jgi:hypothetical protein